MNVRSTLLTVAVTMGALALPGSAHADLVTSPAMAPADTVDAMFQRAGDLYANQNYSEAIPIFNRVIELQPRHGNAYALLGGSYFQLGDYPKAIDAFERAIQLDEGIKLAYLGLVAANYLTERVDDARHWLDRLIPILTGEERERYLATITDQFPGLETSPAMNSGGI